ncbi:MAG TPA: DNA-3-methyladenine glycosylase [Candidatus Thermoplasmatota archaeon]|nr:DNA-3-methyladenine glycosylase [Candidatus Thermoplasmatota archaeon]
MPRKLPRRFYTRPALEVARDLVGKVVVHRTPEGEASGRIVECEAYAGPRDRAAHSHQGRRTARTEAMFLEGGHAYVFFLYGMHWAFNVVCARAGEPQAVLVRAVEPVRGLALMARRRGLDAARRELTNGPGKVCEALGITKAQYGADLCGDALFLEDGVPLARVARSPRVNVAYAGAHAAWPWRFYEQGNRYVSVRPR